MPRRSVAPVVSRPPPLHGVLGTHAARASPRARPAARLEPLPGILAATPQSDDSSPRPRAGGVLALVRRARWTRAAGRGIARARAHAFADHVRRARHRL